MTIHGPGAASPIRYTPPTRPARPPAAPPPQPARSAAPAMPPGADPALWNVLTTEERAYFAELADLGQLSYGPKPTSHREPPVPLGQRVDVRV